MMPPTGDEPSYDPSSEPINDEKICASIWELLRRNRDFQEVAKKWIATESFRKDHVRTSDYRQSLQPCCALDWMLTPDQRYDLAQYQLEQLCWRRGPFPNFGPIKYHQNSISTLTSENARKLVNFSKVTFASPPLRLDMAWPCTPDAFRHQFRFAVFPLRTLFAPINDNPMRISRMVSIIGRKLAQGDPLHEMNCLAHTLVELGNELHDLTTNHRLYSFRKGLHARKSFRSYLEQVTADFNGPHGVVIDARKYDRHKSLLGTSQDWQWFLLAERRHLDINKPAELYELAELYCHDVRSRKMHNQMPLRAQGHGFTGTPSRSKTIKDRGATVKRHILSIQGWIRKQYPAPPNEPSPTF